MKSRKVGSHRVLGWALVRVAGGCLVVVTFIPSVSPPTLIGAVQRSKQFQCATLVVSTGEILAGISADRNCLYEKGPGGVGQKNLVSFSRAGSLLRAFGGWRDPSLPGRDGAPEYGSPSRRVAEGLEPLRGSSTEFFLCPFTLRARERN